MTRLSVVLLLLLSGAVRAQASVEPDPRWLYTGEVGFGVEAVGDFSVPPSVPGATASRPTFTSAFVRALFLAPVAESLQAGGGLMVDGQGFGRVLGGLRLLTGSETWQTKLDMQGALALVSAFSLGIRLGVGVNWEFAPGWRVGGDVGASVLVGHFAATADATLAVGYGF